MTILQFMDAHPVLTFFIVAMVLSAIVKLIRGANW